MSQFSIEQLSDDYRRGDISLSDFERGASELVAVAYESTTDKPSAPGSAVVPDIDTRFRASSALVKRLTARVKSLEARVAVLESR